MTISWHRHSSLQKALSPLQIRAQNNVLINQFINNKLIKRPLKPVWCVSYKIPVHVNVTALSKILLASVTKAEEIRRW